MKEDEKKLLIDVYQKCQNNMTKNPLTQQGRPWPRDLINSPDFYIHYKRAWYLLEKWSDKGWYEWGTVMDLGWLTREGESAAEKLLIDK